MASELLFPIGGLYITSGVDFHYGDKLPIILECVARHQSGDWGDTDPDDAKLNDEAIQTGDRIMSVWELHKTIWIITEANRKHTTILLPEEY